MELTKFEVIDKLKELKLIKNESDVYFDSISPLKFNFNLKIGEITKEQLETWSLKKTDTIKIEDIDTSKFQNLKYKIEYEDHNGFAVVSENPEHQIGDDEQLFLTSIKNLLKNMF